MCHYSAVTSLSVRLYECLSVYASRMPYVLGSSSAHIGQGRHIHLVVDVFGVGIRRGLAIISHTILSLGRVSVRTVGRKGTVAE